MRYRRVREDVMRLHACVRRRRARVFADGFECMQHRRACLFADAFACVRRPRARKRWTSGVMGFRLDVSEFNTVFPANTIFPVTRQGGPPGYPVKPK